MFEQFQPQLFRCYTPFPQLNVGPCDVFSHQAHGFDIKWWKIERGELLKEGSCFNT